MVCELGMSENLGPLTFGKKEEMVFLGREISTHKDYSEQTAEQIDKEVRAHRRGRVQPARSSCCEDNLDKLHLIANTLLEREVLDGDQMDRLLRGEKLEPLRPVEPDQEAPAPRRPRWPSRASAGQLEASRRRPPGPPGPRLRASAVTGSGVPEAGRSSHGARCDGRCLRQAGR